MWLLRFCTISYCAEGTHEILENLLRSQKLAKLLCFSYLETIGNQLALAICIITMKKSYLLSRE